jgi:carbon-monoxide dehydrogenase small subunit
LFVALDVTPESQRAAIHCTVNGEPVTATFPVHRILLDFLRADLGLLGAKLVCDAEICGACTVLVDGLPVSACTYLAVEVDGASVRTCEGLGSDDALDLLQQSFVECGAFQCGYCTPGMLMAVTALLDEEPRPTREAIAHHLAGNLCRCTGYQKILTAVEKAIDTRMAAGGKQ